MRIAVSFSVFSAFVFLFAFAVLSPLPAHALMGCGASYEPVCGFKEVCMLGSCTYYRTYINACAMRAEGGDFMHEGPCEGAQKAAAAEYAQEFFPDRYELFPRHMASYDFFSYFSAMTTRLLHWAK